MPEIVGIRLQPLFFLFCKDLVYLLHCLLHILWDIHSINHLRTAVYFIVYHLTSDFPGIGINRCRYEQYCENWNQDFSGFRLHSFYRFDCIGDGAQNARQRLCRKLSFSAHSHLVLCRNTSFSAHRLAPKGALCKETAFSAHSEVTLC